MRHSFSAIVLLFFLNGQLGYTQRITEGLLASYSFNQCECEANEAFSPSTETSSTAPSLTKSNLVSCPTKEGFGSPTSQGFLVIPPDEPISVSGTDVNTDFGLVSDDVDAFNFNPTNGLTLEHHLKPRNLFTSNAVTTMVLSELRQVGVDFPAFPDFHCSIAFNPRKPNELEVIYGSAVLFNYESFRFRGALEDFDDVSGPEKLLHVVCGFRVVAGNVVPFACVDGECQDDDGFVATPENFVNPSNLLVGSKLSTSPFRRPVETQIVSLHVYQKGLSDAEVKQNFDDQSILKSFPVLRNDLTFIGQEDEEGQIFSNLNFFFDDDGDESNIIFSVDVDAELTQGSVSQNNLPVTNLVDLSFFTPDSNLFSSADGVCSDDDFIPAIEAQIFDENDQSCILPSVVLKGCFVEVNDAPVAEAVSLRVGRSTNPIQFSFVPGFDVDDEPQNGQQAEGILEGGEITLKLNSLLGTLSTSDGISCTGTTLNDGSKVEIVNGEVSMCYLSPSNLAPGTFPTSLGSDRFEFSLADSLDETNDVEVQATLDVVNLLQTCSPDGNGNNPCITDTRENAGTNVVLVGEVLDGGDLIFRTKLKPRHGSLFKDESQNQPIGENEVLESETIFYVPDQFYFNANDQDSSTDGLGKSICSNSDPKNQDGNCFDVISFEIEFEGITEQGSFEVIVTAVDNQISRLEVETPEVIPGESTVVPGAIILNSESEGDMHKSLLTLTPSDGVSLAFPDIDNVFGVTYKSDGLPNGCTPGELCSESVVLEGFPSAFNELFETFTIFVDSATSTADASVDIQLIESGTVSQIMDFNEGEQSSSIIPIVGAAGGGLVLIALLVGFFTLRRRVRRRDSGESMVSVKLPGEEINSNLAKPAPPNQPKKAKHGPKPPEGNVPSDVDKRYKPKPPTAKGGSPKKEISL